MAHPLAPGEHGVVKLLQIKRVDVSRDVLEPDHCIASTVLKSKHVDLPLFLIGSQRLRDRHAAVQVSGKRDSVLKAELGSRANRKVGGVGGVTDQDNAIVFDPVIAVHRREVDPGRSPDMRGVGEQFVATEVVFKYFPAGLGTLCVCHVLKADSVVNLWGCFYNECRG